MRGLVALAPARFPRIQDVQIDGGVLLFTLAVTLATGVLFGLLPALQAARGNVHDALKAGGRGGAGSRGGWLRKGLVVGEVALSTLLLVGAGLLLRSFLELQKVNPGFQADGLVSFRVALPESRFDTPEKSSALFERLRERLLAVPGVKNVGVVSSLPFSGNNSSGSFTIESRVVPEGEYSPHADVRNVNWDYFRTMGMALQRGRGFTEQDRADGELVAMVDEKLARQYWPEKDPIGERITRSGRSGGRWHRIVGVVSHVKHARLDAESKGALYFPLPQMRTQTLNVMVRSGVDPETLAGPVRRELAAVDPSLPLYDLRTMQDRLLDSMLPQRVAAWLLGGLALVALLLAGVGIYGVLSQTVLQRRPEIGIRMALGARRGQVLRLILRQGMILAAAGLALGAGAAALAVRGMAKLLYGVTPYDAATYAAVAA
jgi:putative ABC transport system permease protein